MRFDARTSRSDIIEKEETFNFINGNDIINPCIFFEADNADRQRTLEKDFKRKSRLGIRKFVLGNIDIDELNSLSYRCHFSKLEIRSVERGIRPIATFSMNELFL